MKIMENEIEKKNILVLGDIMLDRYYEGAVQRISPEAPVPVFLEKKIDIVLGGAGNVAVNIKATGQNVSIASVIGKDDEGETLIELLEKEKIDHSLVNFDSQRQTTVKNRFLGENKQQILRHDREVCEDLSVNMQEELLSRLFMCIDQYDLIVVSDYGKGICTEYLLQSVIKECDKYNKKVLADVKGKETAKYKGSYLVKPNRNELGDLIGRKLLNINDVVLASKELCQQCKSEYVLTTCGPDGMVAVDKNGEIIRINSIVQDVYDVTGAGDTVLSFLAMGIANDMKMEEVLKMANYAASIQVSKVGTSIVSIFDVQSLMSVNKHKKKILSVDEIVDIVAERGDKKVVFTNGCYDIIHVGHIQGLKDASELGDILIVALNSDASITRLKGKNRPINQLKDRMCVLASIEYVDYVTYFEEDTPYEIISKVKPDILVKGSDYKEENVVGKDIVESYGGRVEVVSYRNGKSTTDIIQKNNLQMCENN